MKKNYLSILILIFVFLFVSSITLASEDRVSLGYIYNSSKSHTEIVDDTKDNINTVSPTCFDLTSKGHLDINNIFDQDFVNEMHERGVVVTPFLSNHWGRKKAEAALNIPDVLADEIVSAIVEYNLDGVNVDLENLLAKDKDKLTNFIRILREKLPEGKLLSIAVGANPNRLTNSWVSAYDYAALSEYVDYMVLMAYDEHSDGGSEGPVASIGFVEESVKVMLESVSRDKIVLGMPLYGRFWKQGEDVGGEAIIESQIEKIAKRYNVVPVYNKTTGTATFTINVKEGDKKAYINGRYLEEGVYTIYYENENSITRKFDVVNQYGLKGAALWAIGNESDSFWNYYSKGINYESYESEEHLIERVEREEEEKRQIEYLKSMVVAEVYDTTLKVNYTYNALYSKVSIKNNNSIKDYDAYKIATLSKKDYQKVEKQKCILNKNTRNEKNIRKEEKHSLVHIIKRQNNGD